MPFLPQIASPLALALLTLVPDGGQPVVDVGGYGLWVQLAGEGSPTVVFESGGGDDASAWASVEPEVRRRGRVRTLVYDRAGLGHSDNAPGPYRIDNEASALRRALDKKGVLGPLVLVAHSYGGFVAALLAAEDARVAGVVLVDANLAGFFNSAEVARLQARYSPHFDELKKANPALARVLVPLMLAYPETAKRVREVSFPLALPTIDITAEHTWVDTPEEISSMRRVHADFVAASPAREAVVATGSGHNVMHDRPDVVIEAVLSMVERIRTAQ
jgi:pimeloyl-ACP methyl ester carboxylesterase